MGYKKAIRLLEQIYDMYYDKLNAETQEKIEEEIEEFYKKKEII